MPRKDERIPVGRILVVDDQPDICWVLSKLLSERGHEVRTAQSGADALAALASFECQVAVVDYRLPDANGIELIPRMTERSPRLRAILMTSYGNALLRQGVIDQDLFAYFDKPFNNELMIRTVEDAVRASESGGDSLAKGALARTQFPGGALSQE
ncbi:MAG: response regulator [Deltaproteobacteria bacterium]|nr:response regulator [Deltaproteobacteria bacterium]